MQAEHDLFQTPVLAQCEQLPVKTVFSQRPVVEIVSSKSEVHVPDMVFKLLQVFGRNRLPGKFRDGQWFESAEYVVDLQEILHCHAEDPDTAPGHKINQSVGLQTDQCLTNRRPAHSEPFGDIRLRSLGSGGQLGMCDLEFQTIIGIVNAGIF